MKNLLRALRFSLQYRGRIIFSLVCALLAALFWSLNFTAIYPVLKIISTDKNLQENITDAIRKTQKNIDECEERIQSLKLESRDLDKQPPGRERAQQERRLAGRLAHMESKLESARQELYRNQIARRFIDMLFPSDRFQTLVMLICLVVGGMAFKGFFEFCQDTLVGSVVNKSLYDLRNRFFRKAIHLDMSHFNEQGTHELMARFTNDMELLGAGQKMLFGKMVVEPLKALGCVLFACWISWQLTLMFLILVPVALAILTWVGRMMKRATRRMLERMSHIYQILQETFRGIRIVKAFTRESGERCRFREATGEYYHRAMRVVRLDAMADPIIELLGIAAVAGALVVGAYLVLNRRTDIFGLQLTDYPLEAESLLQLYAYLAAIADPVRKLSSFWNRLQSGAAASDRIFHIMDREPRVQQNSEGLLVPRHSKDIEFKNVCFSYEPGHPILSGVDLHVQFGETIALVGKNGCGKSTLVGLISRFYDPDHGAIFVDGVELRTANLRSLRRQIGLVTQDTMLFDDTVLKNIAYGKPRATRAEVEQVARHVFAHDFIIKLPQGYDTRVGEAGTKLSGGQKQRIALARAILRNPSILILDEFTSQTDAESEAIIHRVLREFMRNRTTFVITHRLNTLEISDRIVVIEGGRIAAVGKHADLLKDCSLYQRLHEAHFQRRVA
jgi:subfamily B ATP-binding cassette protein MsbA